MANSRSPNSQAKCAKDVARANSQLVWALLRQNQGVARALDGGSKRSLCPRADSIPLVKKTVSTRSCGTLRSEGGCEASSRSACKRHTSGCIGRAACVPSRMTHTINKARYQKATHRSKRLPQAMKAHAWTAMPERRGSTRPRRERTAERKMRATVGNTA